MSDGNPTAGDNSASQSSFGLLPRPAYQLRSLPIELRWEVTRRHPYYLAWWSPAREFHEGAPVEQPAQLPLRQAAVAILGAIGVSGPPISPETPYENIGGVKLERAGMAGLIHPVSNRGLMGLLITALPKSTLSQLGMLLTQSFAKDGDVDEQRIQALLQLAERQDPGLDEFVNEFIVSVAPTASQRAIAEDLATQLKR